MEIPGYPELGKPLLGWLERIKSNFQLNRIDRQIAHMQQIASGSNAAFALEESIVQLDFSADTIHIRHLCDGDTQFELVETRQEWDGSVLGYNASTFQDGPQEQKEYQTYSTSRTENSLPVSELAREVNYMAHIVSHGQPVSRPHPAS